MEQYIIKSNLGHMAKNLCFTHLASTMVVNKKRVVLMAKCEYRNCGKPATCFATMKGKPFIGYCDEHAAAVSAIFRSMDNIVNKMK